MSDMRFLYRRYRNIPIKVVARPILDGLHHEYGLLPNAA